MNKTDIVCLLQKEAKLTPEQAENALETIINGIVGALERNDNVSISKLGSFSCVERRSRDAHNPKTGQKIKIPSRKAVKFKPSKSFKDLIESLPVEG